ncbi:MAG: FtsB family cell division protein [Mangrovibacterium sp.]
MKMPKWIRERLLNKYGIATILFLVYILAVNEHNLIQHFQNKTKLSQLEEQEDRLRTKIEADKQKINELQTNQENLAKFAREQFLMHQENEDVFVVVE